MNLIRVAGAALNQTPLAWDANAANIVGAIEDARQAGATVLTLPELAVSGYGCEDAFFGPGVPAMSMEVLTTEIVPATAGMIVAVGLPVAYRNTLFNCAAVIADQRLLGFVAKRYLAGDGVHYEQRWFRPWPAGEQAHAEVNGEVFPIGDLAFDIGGLRIGFEICEDAWVAGRPGTQLAARGADLILNPSASHFAFDKIDVRRRFVLEGSRAFGVSYVYTNLLGNEAGRIIYDGGVLIASGGRMVAEGPRLSFQDRVLTSAVIDVEATRMGQARSASFRPDLHDDGAGWIRATFSFPAIDPETGADETPSWEASSRRKEEEFTRAVALGLFDYARKSRSSGFVVSLSGGADSAAVACLVRYMVDLGVAELGTEEFARRLHIPMTPHAANDALVRTLLTTVYQATRNSTHTTLDAARVVAAAIGATHIDLNVDAIVGAYWTMIEQAMGRAITWETDDLPLQNLQARVRAPGVWMIANLKNALLLTTSNRSEAAVGYATMDGDTAGGLGPVEGIDKEFLREWLYWVETEGPDGAGAIPEVRAVNVQAPTAELRPPAAGQTDEADLMPYGVLNAIESLGIRDRSTPVDVFRRLRVEFPNVGSLVLVGWIEKFYRLWCRNQWKRERYAPAFHLDDRNLDPRSWCRFPILSGGFARELASLRAYVAGSREPPPAKEA